MGAEREIWKQRRKQRKLEEAGALVGVGLSGANTQTCEWGWGGGEKKLQKCIGQEINIPTLNEQLLLSWGMSIYEGLQGSDPEVLWFVIFPLTPSICPPGQRLLSDHREEAFKG